MIRTALLATTLSATAMLPGWGHRAETVTLTGWFSDEGCARARVKAETVTPNGTVCVRRCLDEGATAVFVDPKARAIYTVKDYPGVKEDVGYYLEVQATVDETAKTISIASVKRLGDVIQMCARPPKK